MCVREREYVVVRISTQKANVQSKEESWCLHVNKELATAWSRDIFVDVHTHSNTQENLIGHRHVKRRQCLKRHFNSFENDGAKEFCCGRLVVQKCWSAPICWCLCVFLCVCFVCMYVIFKKCIQYIAHIVRISIFDRSMYLCTDIHTLSLSLSYT